MKEIQVILLAGGKSTRFWPLTHKLLLPFCGKNLIEHQLELLERVGLKDIMLVGTAEVVKRFAGGGLKTVIQKGDGQDAAILSAKNYIKSDPILVVNADDIVSTSLFESLLYLADEKKNLLVGYKTPTYFPGGYLVLDGKRVVEIQEKPGVGKEPSQFVRLVCDYFLNGQQLLEYIRKYPRKDAISGYENAVSKMMKEGEVFEMLEYEDTWIPLKYPWQTLDVMNYFLSQIKDSCVDKSAKVHASASINGNVWIGENTRILEYAKIVGPAYIGAGGVIGNHTLVRNSMIGENSVVGFGTEITRSYIGQDSWFHTNYVGDSVISANVGLGAGAVLANLRLDEKEIYSSVKTERLGSKKIKLGTMIGENVRIGIEAQLMPGVKIGKGCIVGPGVILTHDLPEQKYCYVRQSHAIKKITQTHPKSRAGFHETLRQST